MTNINNYREGWVNVATIDNHRRVSVGTWARHVKFGIGPALRARHCDDGRMCRCEATFGFSGGEKRLLLRYAPIEILAGRDDFDSPPEIRLYLNMVSAGMPLPETQHRVGRYRVDLAYPSIKLAIEVDGLEFHGRMAMAL